MAQPSASQSQTISHVSLERSTPPRLMPVPDNLISLCPSELKPSVLQPSTRLPLSSSPSPRSSLYLAVKVRSLVNVFRKRAKRRSQTVRRKADDASFCRDIESEAYREIDRYLGRKPRRRFRKFEEGATEAGVVGNDVIAIGATSTCERTSNAQRCVIYHLPTSKPIAN